MKIRRLQTVQTTGDLLPLMDCMFILLIYFIFSMLDMTSYPGIKVEMPDAYSSSKSTDPFNTITIMGDEYFLNKKKITLETLQEELEILSLDDLTITGKKLHIAAEKTVDTHLVFKLLETLRKIDKKTIYIETMSRSKPIGVE